MKILYINLYEGCFEPWRFKKVIAFIKGMNPDIVGLSELNSWQNNNFEKLNFFKSKTGLKFHAFAQASSGYNIGLFSSYPLVNKLIITKGFNTGLIKAEVCGYTILLTHLHHANESLRLNEVKIIKKYLNNKEKIVLMGDLNSLSPSDKYNEEELIKQLKKIQLEKFGKNKLKKKVISKILSFGLIDAVKQKSKKFEYSVPSAYNKDPKHFNKLRLDYIFISANLKKKLLSAKIIRNKKTNQVSDHFPVLVKIK